MPEDESTESTEAAEAAFLKALNEGWVAGYPPWFWKHLVQKAGCRTQEEGERLLHLLRSIEDGQPDDTRRLLAEGIDANLRLGEEEGRLIEFASTHGKNPDCIRALLEAGANPRGTRAVFELISYHQNKVLSDVLKAGVDVDEVRYGCTALASAVMAGNVSALRQLVDAGADVNRVSELPVDARKVVKNCSPLMFAAHFGEVAMVKLLLKFGADPHHVDAQGNNVITWARASRSKVKASKIIGILEKEGVVATAGKSAIPQAPDFSSRAKSPEFKKAIAIVRMITGSVVETVELAEGPLPGAKAFRVADDARALLNELTQRLVGLNCMAFLSEDVTSKNGFCIVLLPTTDYREAITAFETPEGQSITSEDLVRWLESIRKQQPFEIVELKPDLLRATFSTEIVEPLTLAKNIEEICPDVINEPLPKVATNLARSRELYLWWD